ncbi:MAG: hypothetical protein LBL82_05895 [Oscillospiraceae bacterium]|jgi:hypothetical protein|nr:hypothetical protein [Oscillospiraceae bacterium]
MINYLFSNIDIAFFALMYESILPELVPNPFTLFSAKKLEERQRQFYERQQISGVLEVNGEDVTLSENLARVLSPIFEGDIVLYHIDNSIYNQIAEYDAAFYISEKFGVTLMQREKAKEYRVIWYPNIDSCYPDFLTGFSLDKISSYSEKPFKLCGDAAEMSNLLGYGRKGKIKKLADYAAKNEFEPERLCEILKNISDNNNAVIIDIGRSDLIKKGGIKAKLLLERQEMMRFLASPDGDLITFESFSNENILRQIINFEGK